MNKSKLKKIDSINYGYPSNNDPEFQKKIYERYFYYMTPKRKGFSKYKELEDYRDKVCKSKVSPFNHQAFLKSFITPNTPYTGLLLLHGTGTGKTCSAVQIAENFKHLVRKYNTKIYVLVKGPLLKEQWREQIRFCTGDEYLKNSKNLINITDDDQGFNEDNEYSINKNISAYYRILSYKGFHKRVLGEKISTSDKSNVEREFSIDKLESLDNTLLIVDEAHNITKNEWGEAINCMIKKSRNIRVLLLTATPMKNLADEIVELINLLRPKNDPIIRDKVFTKEKGYKMDFIKGGEEYLSNMASGYVSYYRGNDPLLFAKQVDMGKIPKFLKFTPIIKCKMRKLQLKTYKVADKMGKDGFERKVQSCSLFTFPTLDNKGNIEGSYGLEGLKRIQSQLKDNMTKIQKKINKTFFNNKIKDISEIIYEDTEKKNISGLIFNKKYLGNFSTKYLTCLNNLELLVKGKKGPGIAFIYCALVTIGIELFEKVLINNGYLEYKDNSNYNIIDTTVDYETGLSFKEYKKKYPKNKFYPATFISVTGAVDEYGVEDIPEVKQRIIKQKLNTVENKYGQNIKFILGSQVMSEGITLENIREVHILDVWHNLNRSKQIIGRAIRWCTHVQISTRDNPYPEVNVYRYVASLGKKRSIDEKMYKRGEYKYVTTKKVEYVLKKASIDCPINHGANMFDEELKNNKTCKPLTIDDFSKKTKHKFCPSICDFKKCEYKCVNNKLNLNYYNNNTRLYKEISVMKIDKDIFINDLMFTMSNKIKKLLQNLFRRKYVYTFTQIEKYIDKMLEKKEKKMYNKFFLYKSLNDLIPESENDFNNFSDTIYDKYNVPGYLIYRGIYYIFQPYKEDTNVPINYRKAYKIDINKEIDLFKLNEELSKNRIVEKKVIKINKDEYNFDDTDFYYDKRTENKYVGILDKNKKKPVFKLRLKRKKILEKKRGIGIPSAKGAVCSTGNDKDDLIEIAKELKIKLGNDKNNKFDICNEIKKKLIFLEKYSEDNDKKTYIIIPLNHEEYEFPLNLQDRVEYYQKKIQKKFENININIKKDNNGMFMNSRSRVYVKYKISLNAVNLNNYDEYLISKKFKKIDNDNYERIIE
jgi:hypothetical protein